MPRWIERRGFTLRVPDIEQRNGAARQGYVRLSLMERVGLVSGWFNVREARAETAETGDDAGISAGRALSWRWLRKLEAERLLEQRLETLETMGYTLVDAAMTVRGRWDWLYDLVHRQLHGKDGEDDKVAAKADPPAADALRHALSRLGLSPDAVIEGVAAVLSLTPHALSHPDAAVVRRTDPEELGVLLPFLLRHEHADVHEIGQRWLRCPEVAYQLPRGLLLGWLENDEGIGRVLGPRLQTEGLAMLGPDALLRLSRTGSAPVRGPARTWSQRLGSV